LTALTVHRNIQRRRSWTERVRSFGANDSDKDKPNYSVKRLSPWLPVHREFSMDWPGVEFGPLQQEASDKPPVPRRGTTTGITLHLQERFCTYFSSLSKISAVHRRYANCEISDNIYQLLCLFCTCLFTATFITRHVSTQ